MAISHERVTIGNTATQVSSNFGGKDGQTVAVQNPSGGSTVYLGGVGVTTGEYGFELLADTTFTIEMQDGEKLFGVTTTNQTVNVIRQGA
jgi:hypothetical protein